MDIVNKVLEIETSQNSLKKKDGNFTQKLRKVEDGFDFEVYDYGNPKHNYWGYQIIFYENREDGEYISSVGYGFEEKERTYDWRKVIIQTEWH